MRSHGFDILLETDNVKGQTTVRTMVLNVFLIGKEKVVIKLYSVQTRRSYFALSKEFISFYCIRIKSEKEM